VFELEATPVLSPCYSLLSAPLLKGAKAVKKAQASREEMKITKIRPDRSPNGVVYSIVFNKQKSVLGRILTVTLNARALR